MSLLVCQECSTRYAPDIDRCPHCSSTRRVEDGGRGPLLPFVVVACTVEPSACRGYGIARRVHLRGVGPGVVEWPSLICAHCGSALEVLRSWLDKPTENESDEESGMPRITVHGGPSNAAVDLQPEPAAEPAPVDDAGESGELVVEPSDDGQTPLPPAVEGDLAEQEVPGIKRPARSAPKPEWVAFAKAINERGGGDDRDPELFTKAQLIEAYGELGEE